MGEPIGPQTPPEIENLWPNVPNPALPIWHSGAILKLFFFARQSRLTEFKKLLLESNMPAVTLEVSFGVLGLASNKTDLKLLLEMLHESHSTIEQPTLFIRQLMKVLLYCPGLHRVEAAAIRHAQAKNRANEVFILFKSCSKEDLLAAVLDRNEVDWRNEQFPLNEFPITLSSVGHERNDVNCKAHRELKSWFGCLHHPSISHGSLEILPYLKEKWSCKARKVWLAHEKFVGVDVNTEDVDRAGHNALVFSMLHRANNHAAWQYIYGLKPDVLRYKWVIVLNLLEKNFRNVFTAGSNEVTVFHLFTDVAFLRQWWKWHDDDSHKRSPWPHDVLNDFFCQPMLEKLKSVSSTLRRAGTGGRRNRKVASLSDDVIGSVACFLVPNALVGTTRNAEFQNKFMMRNFHSLDLYEDADRWPEQLEKGTPVDLAEATVKLMASRKNRLHENFFDGLVLVPGVFECLEKVHGVMKRFYFEWQKLSEGPPLESVVGSPPNKKARII